MELPAGATTIDIKVQLPLKPTADQRLKGTGQIRTQAVVTLQPGNDYRLGTGIMASVALKWRPDPSVAGDDFAGHAHGWLSPWTRTLGTWPGFGVKVMDGAYFRTLTQRMDSGNVWFSFRLTVEENPTSVAGFSLFDQGHEAIFIGHAFQRDGLTLKYLPNTPRSLVLPEHQFATPARFVVCVRMTAPECVISWWVSPVADGVEPPGPLGTVKVPLFAIDSVWVFAEQAWAIADLRIDRSWEEVVPLP